MKNRLFVLFFSSIILTIIVCFFCLFKYSSNTLDEHLLNKKWYQYDNSTGYYNTFYMDGINLEYSLPGNTDSEYDSCKKYNYNKSSNELSLDCNKKIQINEVGSNYIVLIIDSKKIKFFDNIDDSLNYEFESYHDKSISEYKNEMSRVSELIKINKSSFIDIFNSGDESRIIFYSDNCTSVDCVLSLDIIEKWISVSGNIHYIDINEFTDEDINAMNILNSDFSVDRNYYNGIYPRVIVIKNSDIINTYEIKCSGFNCDKIAK